MDKKQKNIPLVFKIIFALLIYIVGYFLLLPIMFFGVVGEVITFNVFVLGIFTFLIVGTLYLLRRRIKKMSIYLSQSLRKRKNRNTL